MPPRPRMPPPSSTARSASSDTADFNQSWWGWRSESSGATAFSPGEGTGVPGAVPNSDWSDWANQRTYEQE
eukprot:8900139-Prorocentrum_lima.AAC.1